MRKPEYISPSALFVFEKSPEQYYIQYLCDTRTPRMPQNNAMAAGSAFDAYVKSYLHDVIYHNNDPKYQLQNLFEAQVEPQCRTEAWGVGAYLFDEYKRSGALSDLMLELNSAVDEPRFEFDLKGTIEHSREGVTGGKMGVVLMGKPDLRIINAEGAHVIYDWKVNGYYSNWNISPKPGYVQLRQNGIRKGAHKDCYLKNVNGIQINSSSYLEDIDMDWATQLSTYGWLLGEPVGAEVIVGIEQLCCKKTERRPEIRVASHRTRVRQKTQYDIIARYQNLWSILNTEPFYFFRDMSFEESKLKCQMLDRSAGLIVKDNDPMVKFVMENR